MLKWQQLHKRSNLKRMINDTEQSSEGLRVKLNETLDDILVGICDMCNLLSYYR